MITFIQILLVSYVLYALIGPPLRDARRQNATASRGRMHRLG